MKINPFIEISGRRIGLDYPPLVIAELGINHNGSLETAKRLVDAASAVGVEIIKHQTHIPKEEMSSHARKVIPRHTKESIYDIIDSCSLTESEEYELKSYIESKGIIFISTPFSRAAANRLLEMKVPALKIGSGECNNYPLIKHIAKFGKPVILSTGMNSLESVAKSVAILKDFQVPYAILHCTNVYPTPYSLIRLGAITQLMQRFPEAVVGLSDHSVSNFPCIGAVALGASILERHFTDSMERVGPDIICSMDPIACTELLQASNIVFQSRGGSKGIVPEEVPTASFAFATVVTIRPVKANERFTMDNIWVKRPGTGDITAEFFDSILGRKAARDLPEDTQIGWDDMLSQ